MHRTSPAGNSTYTHTAWFSIIIIYQPVTTFGTRGDYSTETVKFSDITLTLNGSSTHEVSEAEQGVTNFVWNVTSTNQSTY